MKKSASVWSRQLRRGAPPVSWLSTCGALLALLFAGAAPGAIAASDRPSGEYAHTPHSSCDRPSWVASWGLPSKDPGPSYEDQTIRVVIRPSIGGSRTRIWLSNVAGDRSLRVSHATVAIRQAGASAVAGSVRDLSFDGKKRVTVPRGGRLVSDPVRLGVERSADVLVSIYASGATGPTTGGSPTPIIDQNFLAEQYVAQGDRTQDVASDNFGLRELGGRIVDGLDVYTPNDGAIVAFGDSITEATQARDPFSRVLNTRLAAMEPAGGPRLGVVNMGIAANQVLKDGTSYGGQSALGRFERDALSRTGVTHVVMMEGINDINQDSDPQLATKLAWGFRELGKMARRADVALTLSPLTPAGTTLRPSLGGWRDEQVLERHQINEWIRSSRFYDPRVDFDLTLQNPLNADWLRFDADSGDGLHPNATGHKLMGESIGLEAIAAASCSVR